MSDQWSSTDSGYGQDQTASEWDSGQSTETDARYTDAGYTDSAYGETAEAEQDYAMFELIGGGIGVMPDPSDNDNNHQVPHHESSTRISFEVVNVGTTAGNANVQVYLDDTYVTDWQSGWLDPGGHEVGYVGLGRLAEGRSTVVLYINPGSGQNDHDSNEFDVK